MGIVRSKNGHFGESGHFFLFPFKYKNATVHDFF